MTYVKRRGRVVNHHMATNWGGPIDDVDEVASPCELPSIDDFLVRFPEFSAYSDMQVSDALDDAWGWADTSWSTTRNDCMKAIMFLAAHYLYLQALAVGMIPDIVSDGQGGVTVIAGGHITSLGFETMRVGFSSPRAVANRGGGTKTTGAYGTYDLSTSPYGQRYLDLLQVNVPAVLVV